MVNEEEEKYMKNEGKNMKQLKTNMYMKNMEETRKQSKNCLYSEIITPRKETLERVGNIQRTVACRLL
jgi:hypothetical protein